MSATATHAGVIFDLDGTLYHVRKARFWVTLSLWRSIAILRHMTKARTALRGKVFEDAESLMASFAAELATRAKITPEQAARWYDHDFIPAFIDLLDRRAVPRPGLLRLLSRLRSAGLKLAVVSDIGWVDERLRAIGLPPEAFDILACAESSGELKPSPRPLLDVAASWNIEPNKLLVVGDRLDRDAPSAAAAGMEFIGIDNRSSRFLRRHHSDNDLLSWREASQAISAGAGLSYE